MTKSIAALPGWDASPSQVSSQLFEMNYIMWYDSAHLWIAMSVNLKTRGSHLHFGSDSFEILQKIFSIFPSQCFPPYLSLCSCSVGQNVFIPYIEAIIMSGRFYSFGVPYKLLGGERYSYQRVLPGQHEDSKLHLSASNLEKRQQHSKPCSSNHEIWIFLAAYSPVLRK